MSVIAKPIRRLVVAIRNLLYRERISTNQFANWFVPTTNAAAPARNDRLRKVRGNEEFGFRLQKDRMPLCTLGGVFRGNITLQGAMMEYPHPVGAIILHFAVAGKRLDDLTKEVTPDF